jgi:hypothetical protein
MVRRKKSGAGLRLARIKVFEGERGPTLSPGTRDEGESKNPWSALLNDAMLTQRIGRGNVKGHVKGHFGGSSAGNFQDGRPLTQIRALSGSNVIVRVPKEREGAITGGSLAVEKVSTAEL